MHELVAVYPVTACPVAALRNGSVVPARAFTAAIDLRRDGQCDVLRRRQSRPVITAEQGRYRAAGEGEARKGIEGMQADPEAW